MKPLRQVAIAATLLTVLAGGPGQASSAAPEPVPAGFRAYSMSFVTIDEGWALGRDPCGRQACTYVVHTDDGGRRWSTAGRVPARLAVNNGGCQGEQSNCVSEVVFASKFVGYVFDPSLLITRDGGRSWRRIEGAEVHQVIATGEGALRVADAEPTATCYQGCRLQRSVDGGHTWSDLPTAPVVHAAGVYVRVGDQRHLYLVGGPNPASGAWNKRAVVYRSEDGGHAWRSLADPCSGFGFALDLVALPSDVVVVLCDAPAGGADHGLVIVSTDGARSFTSPHPVPGGFPVPFAAGSAITFSATDEGIETTRDGGRQWRTTLGSCSAGVPPPSYPDGEAWALQYVTPSVVHVLCPSDRFWTTRDAGEHWTSRRFRDD